MYNFRRSADTMVTSPVISYTGVRFVSDNQEIAFAGSDSGLVMEIDCPWGTQAIAQNILTNLRAYKYQPFSSDGVIFNPAVELGDVISIDGVTSQAFSMDTSYGGIIRSDIEAPEDDEVESEYPYNQGGEGASKREIAKARAQIQVQIDQIKLSVENEAEQRHSEIMQTIDSIRLSVENDADGRHATIMLWVPGADEPFSTAKILMDGSVNISGTLSAQALYSAFGDIADLSVDKLRTSRRIPKYLVGDTSDDNYISIKGERIQYISGVCSGGTEQATNPDGVLIYWERDPSTGTIGANGYPYYDNVPIYTVTTETPWPVTVYTYDELVKGEYKFEQNDRGDYVPVMVFGAGDAAGNDKLRIEKAVSQARVLYQVTPEKQIGMTMSQTGYTDLYGMRRTTEMDFSSWDSGYFVERIEGLDEAVQYSVDFDEFKRPIRIYTEHHAAAIKW